jgi:hypothetical protein
MKLKLIGAITFLIVNSFFQARAMAWAEAGHAIISYLAYSQLPQEKQLALEELLRSHPNWNVDFAVPEELPAGAERKKWFIGRVGYWPDIAREYEEYNRPTWHFQLGACMTMGDVSNIAIPNDPIELPADADMNTQELYVLQALELCDRVLSNKENPQAQRAIALCWVVHLIADLHLPCHSGSLYAQSVFADPDGDRGANRIRIGEQSLHAFWDQLLGNIYERGDVNRRVYELTNDPALVERAKVASTQMEAKVWLLESRSVAEQYLYTAEIQQAIRAAIDSREEKLPSIRLTNEYGKSAGRIAQVRAVEAAARLAKVLEKAL